ncbi:MAG: adenylate/guanylate cyclase domain-containing protein [Propylenella sp.]
MSVDSVTATPLLLGGHLQRLRIASGLILFTFAFFHFFNHSLGIWSVEAMETFQDWRTAVTRSLAGTTIIFGAFFTHIGLNLYKIASRSTWRMPLWEAVQILLGLSILPLLMYHAAHVAAANRMEGAATVYSDMLPALWNDLALQQSSLLLIVWTHGCIGLHFWLRLARSYRRIAPLLLAVAVLLPAMALAGFLVAGRDAAAKAAAAAPAAAATGDAYDAYSDDYGGYGSEPAAAGGYDDSYGGGYDDSYGGGSYDDYGSAAPAGRTLTAVDVRDIAFWSALAAIAALPLILGFRWLLRLRRRRVQIGYVAGPSVNTPIGPTLLEISRSHGIPHTSVCGGRARCSTCRVRIEDGAESQPPPSARESATLARIQAPPGVRLACQLRPRGDLKVVRLVRPPDARRSMFAAAADEAGVEQTLAVLFLDIRGFTTLSESRLPYDTVFLLNRFFGEVGDVLNASGGWIDKYLGDGLLALFGLNQPVETACLSALTAAMKIDAALERLNRELAGELPAPLKIGIGLNVGPLVLGRIGHSASAETTVIGPVVNATSRLESLTKELGVQIVAAAALCRDAGLPPGAFPETTVTVRGTTEPIAVLLIRKGSELVPFLEATQSRSAA